MVEWGFKFVYVADAIQERTDHYRYQAREWLDPYPDMESKRFRRLSGLGTVHSVDMYEVSYSQRSTIGEEFELPEGAYLEVEFDPDYFILMDDVCWPKRSFEVTNYQYEKTGAMHCFKSENLYRIGGFSRISKGAPKVTIQMLLKNKKPGINL